MWCTYTQSMSLMMSSISSWRYGSIPDSMWHVLNVLVTLMLVIPSLTVCGLFRVRSWGSC